MRSMWSGFISFGLINIPVKLYSAIEEHRPKFEMFHSKDLSPIRYARICLADGKEVPWEEIVKGYEYREGDYVILTNEDFENAKIQHEQTIDIISFINEEEIDSLYFERPYFLEQGKGGAKPYILLREAMKKSGKVAIAKIIFHNKQQYAILKNYHDILILNQIRLADDLRDFKELNLSDAKVSKEEVEMASMLIEHLSGHFEPKKYHDNYTERLLQIIEQKAKGQKIRKVKKEKDLESTKVVDLMSRLKKSIAEKKKKKTPNKRKTA